ncbi:MAG: uracil-DNA glycosylase [Thiolinea sp.]
MDLHTRNQYMKAMGIPVWMPRDLCIAEPEDEEDTDTNTGAVSADTPPETPPLSTAEAYFKAGPPADHSEHPNTPSAQQRQRTAPAPAKPELPEVSVSAPDCSAMNWSALQQAVAGCQLCALHKSRTQTVFGTGDTQADWMIIGEAPGAEEDRQGEPFVGRAGKLLNNMLAATALPRSAVYISNVLKCRPPNNRDPKPEESALCRGYLERQIALVNPALIIVVGRIAAHNLLQTTTPLGRLRGQVHSLPGSDTPVIVTYHPAYLLRQPAEKRKAWQDLQLARQVMAARQR